MSIRYMGTKSHMSSKVRDIVDSLEPSGNVVDLFSGMGSVAQALSPRWQVTTNDFLEFTTVFSNYRFKTTEDQPRAEALLSQLKPFYRSHFQNLSAAYNQHLQKEAQVIQGGHLELRHYMETTSHVGNADILRDEAKQASKTSDPKSRYRLTYLYFNSGYFSARQALELDSIRYAIDVNLKGANWLRGIAALLSTVSRVINAPGHSAQYLKPRNAETAKRIQKYWAKNCWLIFSENLSDLLPLGTSEWRANNEVVHGDALDFFRSRAADNVGAVYADPPYTRDQYSRYYHLYETLYKYDFPASTGAGRYRDGRVTTAFSSRTQVESAFERLAGEVSKRSVPLILSYPESGLLQHTGVCLKKLLEPYFSSVTDIKIRAEHSTMGGSGGRSKKSATEMIYVCT